MQTLIINIKQLLQVRETSIKKVSGVEMANLPILENAFLVLENDLISDFGLMENCPKLENATIIPPCFIGENVVLSNVTIGPNVSLGKACHVFDSTIKNSLIQTHAHIKNATLDNAMIGNHVTYDGNFTSISIGDYSVLE